MPEQRPEQVARGGEYDVCVVGGGPSGAALALRLGQLGRSVAIADKAPFLHRHLGQSLASGIRPLLEVLGVQAAVESAGFLAAPWATVHWAGQRQRHQVHGGPGLLVDRARFDGLLWSAAAGAPGVRAYQPAHVVRASRDGARWHVALDSGEVLHAKYLAEASGRARIRVCPRARATSRRRIGARTLALYAYWRAADATVGSEETLVESGPEAWYWAAPLPGKRFIAAVFVDPRAERRYDALVARSQLLGPRLSGAQRIGKIHACDATPFVDEEPVGAASIKIGDAALCIDPLSSQGVQTAIGTALHAAVVLNTLLDRPEDAELATEFYRSRLRDSAGFHARAAGELYRRQADSDGGDFWRARAPGAAPEPGPPPLSPESRLSRASLLQFAPVAIANTTHVVQTDGVKVHGEAYAFVGPGIAVAPLLREVDAPMTALALVERWSRRLPAAEALRVLRWAWSRQLIVGAGSDGRSADLR